MRCSFKHVTQIRHRQVRRSASCLAATPHSRRYLLLTLLGLAMIAQAQATTRTYDGGPSGTGTSITTAANWSSDTIPITSDEALFSTVPAGAVTLTNDGTNLTFGDLIWNQN